MCHGNESEEVLRSLLNCTQQCVYVFVFVSVCVFHWLSVFIAVSYLDLWFSFFSQLHKIYSFPQHAFTVLWCSHISKLKIFCQLSRFHLLPKMCAGKHFFTRFYGIINNWNR